MPSGPFQRGTCPSCGRKNLPLDARGRLQVHKPPDALAARGAPKKGTRACPGSKKPPKG